MQARSARRWAAWSLLSVLGLADLTHTVKSDSYADRLGLDRQDQGLVTGDDTRPWDKEGRGGRALLDVPLSMGNPTVEARREGGRGREVSEQKNPKYIDECYESGILAILYAKPNFVGPYVVLKASSAHLQAMLCFNPQSVRLAPEVRLTFKREDTEGQTTEEVVEESESDIRRVGRPTGVDVYKKGSLVSYGEPLVSREEVLARFEAKSKISSAVSKNAGHMRFDKTGEFLLKEMERRKYKKGDYILPRTKAKGSKLSSEAWPSPEACFELTHVRSAQLNCHHDPAWRDLAQEFVPKMGGLTPAPEHDADVVAIENVLAGLATANLVDLDVGSRIQGPCGFDIKHVDVAGDKKKLSLSREGAKAYSHKGGWSVTSQVELVARALCSCPGKQSTSKLKVNAQLFVEQMKRVAELLEHQGTALLYDSSLLLVVGTNSTGGTEGRVKLIDFGKEIHVYQDRFPKLVPAKQKARGQRCAFGCGAKELSEHISNFARGGKAPKRCLSPCSYKVWKGRSCQPILFPKKMDGMRADK